MAGPTQTPRPALPPAYNLSSAAISAQVGVIVTWLVGLAMHALPVVPPVEVQGAVNMLAAGAIAGVVAYVAARMRSAQWARDGEVTGAKKLL
jgi:hypothetical protein